MSFLDVYAIPSDTELRWRESQDAARRHAEAEKQRAEGRQREADQRDLTAALREIERHRSVSAMQRAAELIARIHRITVVSSSDLSVAFASPRDRRITVPPVQCEISFAAHLHESGHCVIGICPRVEPHRPNFDHKRYVGCLECERLAWQAAMKLAPFSRTMFDDLKRCLDTYRRSTRAALVVHDAVADLTSDSSYAARLQARAAHEARLDAYRDMCAWASEPPVLTRKELEKQRRERQIAEIAAIAREARASRRTR